MKISIMAVDPSIQRKVKPLLEKIVSHPDGSITGEIEEGYMTEKRTGKIENAKEHTSFTEYYVRKDDGDLEMVHRSVHVTLIKPAVQSTATAAKFGG